MTERIKKILSPFADNGNGDGVPGHEGGTTELDDSPPPPSPEFPGNQGSIEEKGMKIEEGR